MADTGLPWELPYPLPTDLVRDGADAIKDLAEAVADGLDAAGNAGIGSNVVQAVKLDTFTTTTAGYVTVTGLSATITPTTDNSKILVVAFVNAAQGSGSGNNLQLRLTGGNASTFIGDADGSRTRAAAGTRSSANIGPGTLLSFTLSYLDNPTTTSPVTYSVELGRVSGTAYINRTETDSNASDYPRTASSITVIEVAA